MDFSVEPEFQTKLDWTRAFVAGEIEQLDLAFAGEHMMYDKTHPVHDEVIRPLQQKVKDQGLWACHLDPELGGLGYGQTKLALLNEILGRSSWAPLVFGCQAPDSGNAEILAHYGTPEQKERYLQPLLDQKIVSCYSMTEPQGGADPGVFTCQARRDGDQWVIDGEKWFSSNYDHASFLIVMAVTDPNVAIHRGASMFLVPKETKGLEVIRRVGTIGEPLGTGGHPYVRYNQVRVPADHLLGPEGGAFAVAQTRLGGGRLHHAMRTVGLCQRAFDMMCERVLSRRTQGSLLADKQMTQEAVADSWIQLLQFRLQVLHAAWTVDQVGGHKGRTEIAGVKVAMPTVLRDIVYRSMHLHGSLGVSNELPIGRYWMMAGVMGIADGPTEVHKVTIARQILKQYQPHEGLWPREHLPERTAAARSHFARYLEHEVGNL